MGIFYGINVKEMLKRCEELLLQILNTS